MFRMTRAWALSPIVVLGACILLAAMPVSAQTNDAALRDAEIYAKENGVSVDEAQRRLAQQVTLGETAHRIEIDESATFAGFWIEHSPVYKMVIAFTTDPAVSKQIVSKYFPQTTTDTIEIRQYSWTYKQLQEIQAQTISALRNLGIKFDSALYVQDNRVEVVVADITPVQQAIQSGGLVLHETVRVVEGPLATFGVIGLSATNWVPLFFSGLAVAALLGAAWFIAARRRRLV